MLPQPLPDKQRSMIQSFQMEDSELCHRELDVCKLMKSMLECAIRDCCGHDNAQAEDRRTAYRWIFSDSNVEFSFLWVALHLDMNKTTVREIRRLAHRAIQLDKRAGKALREEIFGR